MWLVLAVVLALGACASKQRRASVTAAEARRWFDNSIAEAPLTTRNEWTEKEQEQLLRRAGLADAVVVGTISLISSARFHHRSRGQSVAFSPKEVLHGALDRRLAGTDVLQLSIGGSDSDEVVAGDAAGHGRFLLFIKHQRTDTDDDAPAFRWVLYRSSDKLIDQIRSMYRWLARERG